VLTTLLLMFGDQKAQLQTILAAYGGSLHHLSQKLRSPAQGQLLQQAFVAAEAALAAVQHYSRDEHLLRIARSALVDMPGADVFSSTACDSWVAMTFQDMQDDWCQPKADPRLTVLS
jgi:hypothetical protein